MNKYKPSFNSDIFYILILLFVSMAGYGVLSGFQFRPIDVTLHDLYIQLSGWMVVLLLFIILILVFFSFRAVLQKFNNKQPLFLLLFASLSLQITIGFGLYFLLGATIFTSENSLNLAADVLLQYFKPGLFIVIFLFGYELFLIRKIWILKKS